jgi:hypothetical protein
MFCIQEILKSIPAFNNKYNCFLYSTHLPKTQSDIDKLFNELKHYACIIIQPHYTNNTYLISNIEKYTNNNCKIIIIPSSHFVYYYPNLTYLKNNENKIIKSPSDYHDKLIFELRHLNDISLITNTFKKHVNDKYYFTEDYLNDLAKKSIQELQNREIKFMSENDYGNKFLFITISTFIKNNYKKKLLFYSMNHPSIHLFKYITDEILKLIDMEEFVGTSKNLDLLNHTRCILYESVKKHVNFDTSTYTFELNNIIDITEYITKCINEYKNHEHILLC